MSNTIDKVAKIGNSIIQHGKSNDRVYLMKLDTLVCNEVIEHIENLSNQNKYTKIFAKVPENAKKDFINNGYNEEAFVPLFYNGTKGCYFMAKYPKHSNRSEVSNKEDIDKVIKTALSKKKEAADVKLNNGFELRELNYEDAGEAAKLYAKVFASYPFPIFDPNYIKQTMNENVYYFGVYKDKKLIALSSAETDIKNQNSEMTDFATDPEYRGQNFSLVLLKAMENKMRQINVKTTYTIARSVSFGMNITFAKSGYEYSGTLINNTFIAGQIESMNIWYKNL